MANIHPTAVVDPSAKIADDVSIGPYSIVGAGVTLGTAVRLHSHVVVEGDTTIGEGTEIFPFASIGTCPQDLKYKGESSALIIGKFNKIREHVTMNPGTEGGGLITRVGDHCLFMVATHVAHDCQVGNNVILANNATLAGHVEVGDFSVIGGLAAIHQFVRIGHHAMIGGMSGVENDVIPYGSVMGERASLSGLNIIGLRRRGFAKDEIHALRHAYKDLFSSQESTLTERVNQVENDYKENPAVQDLLAFIRNSSARGVLKPRSVSDDV